MITAEFLVEWIAKAHVDKYVKENKEVYIASLVNEQLILTCHRVQYPEGLYPHTNLVWINDGVSTLLYQDIVDEKYSTMKHSVGNLSGDFTARENLETVWSALLITCHGY